MAACERCWNAASHEAHMRGGSAADYYREIIKCREAAGLTCTPKEQAGQWWDEERQCDRRSVEEARRG